MATVVNSITPGWRDLMEAYAMLFLNAFARLSAAPQPRPNDAQARSRAVLGHLGLIVIALVTVFLSLCKV